MMHEPALKDTINQSNNASTKGTYNPLNAKTAATHVNGTYKGKFESKGKSSLPDTSVAWHEARMADTVNL